MYVSESSFSNGGCEDDAPGIYSAPIMAPLNINGGPS